MKTLKPILLILTSALLILAKSSAQADKVKNHVVLDVPEESPGVPWYANFARDFVPTDGTYVPIVFWRDPALIPGDFNLLDFVDIPRAFFQSPMVLKGREWWLTPQDEQPFPFQVVLRNDGPTPIYFVELEELQNEIEDDVLTIGELENFASLRVGSTRHLWYDIRNSNHPRSRGIGRERFTAMGEMEGGGGFFVHYTEEFDPETGIRTFGNVVIKFPGESD
jgi:hypothetical protein